MKPIKAIKIITFVAYMTTAFFTGVVIEKNRVSDAVAQADSTSTDLVIFSQFAQFMTELGYTEMKHGKIQSLNDLLSVKSKLLNLLYWSGTEFADTNMIDEISTYATVTEQHGNRFLLALDTALIDSLVIVPVGAGIYFTESGFYMEEYSFTLDGRILTRSLP